MMGVKLSMTLRTGKMSTAIQFRNKTARQVFGATTFSLLASVAIALTPTKASAFDIGGLVDTAMAMQMGHYQGGYAGGHRTHVASRHDSSSDNNDGGVEHDARDPNTALSSPSKSDSSASVHQQMAQGPSNQSVGASQASERDATNAGTEVASKLFDDAPSFSPSR
jgi:hypothetical protein